MTSLKVHWIINEISHYQYELTQHLRPGPDMDLCIDTLERLKTIFRHPAFAIACEQRYPDPKLSHKANLLFTIDDDDKVVIADNLVCTWKELKNYAKKFLQEKTLNDWQPEDEDTLQ